MTVLFFFFNDTATTEIYTLSLHDALPISFFNPMKSSLSGRSQASVRHKIAGSARFSDLSLKRQNSPRSEEHTSELQSRPHLVCRLLLEKKKNNIDIQI